jgi:hypothetical protein
VKKTVKALVYRRWRFEEEEEEAYEHALVD